MANNQRFDSSFNFSVTLLIDVPAYHFHLFYSFDFYNKI